MSKSIHCFISEGKTLFSLAYSMAVEQTTQSVWTQPWITPPRVAPTIHLRHLLAEKRQCLRSNNGRRTDVESTSASGPYWFFYVVSFEARIETCGSSIHACVPLAYLFPQWLSDYNEFNERIIDAEQQERHRNSAAFIFCHQSFSVHPFDDELKS